MSPTRKLCTLMSLPCIRMSHTPALPDIPLYHPFRPQYLRSTPVLSCPPYIPRYTPIMLCPPCNSMYTPVPPVLPGIPLSSQLFSELSCSPSPVVPSIPLYSQIYPCILSYPPLLIFIYPPFLPGISQLRNFWGTT